MLVDRMLFGQEFHIRQQEIHWVREAMTYCVRVEDNNAKETCGPLIRQYLKMIRTHKVITHEVRDGRAQRRGDPADLAPSPPLPRLIPPSLSSRLRPQRPSSLQKFGFHDLERLKYKQPPPGTPDIRTERIQKTKYLTQEYDTQQMYLRSLSREDRNAQIRHHFPAPTEGQMGYEQMMERKAAREAENLKD